MRYSYSIFHHAGKSLVTADALSQAPVKENTIHADTESVESINIYVDQITKKLTTSVPYLENLHQQLRTDKIWSTVM